MTLKMNKDSAVLQAAFLRADQLCLPSSLSSLQKADWSRVGRPVLEAVTEVCGRGNDLGGASAAAAWLKKVVCAVWLKVLSGEAGGEDVEASWRDNPFFPFQNGLPEVNRVVLLELVKSTAAARTFARLLSSLPGSHVCAELEMLARHAMSDPAGEDDVRLFLEVWWELWKGGDEQEDATEAMFARQFARLTKPPGPSPQGAKRLKLEVSDLPAQTADVLHVLLRTLRDLKDLVSTAELCLQALSVSLDALYTTFLMDGAAALPTAEKLRILSEVVSVREENGERLSGELLREALRDMRASSTPSRFRSAGGVTKLADAAETVAGLVGVWRSGGFLDVACSGGSKPSCSAFKLQQSVRRVLAALRKAEAPDAATPADERDELEENALTALLESLESLAFPRATEGDPDAMMRVAAAIIEHRLEDYRSFALLFAGERSWAARGAGALWTDCLEQNQAAFQQLDALVELTAAVFTREGADDAGRCRKLMKVVADIFSALSLRDKNAALAAVLRLSGRGFFGRPSGVPAAVTEGFERELNMAFNCIIQGAAASAQGNLNTAVSLVARVAFQNPEATLRSCCHSAVFNKGAFALMAQILQQLPGLRGHGRRREEARGDEEEEDEEEEKDTLLAKCLLEAIGTKSLSSNEKEQLREYLGLLMTPVTAVEGEEEEEEGERRRSFLTPQDVVNVFVLPNLSTRGQRSIDVELSLRLLQTALSVGVQEASGPHWVLNCSPFPLLYVLAQLHNQTLRCWEQQPEDDAPCWSMDAKELLVSVLTALGRVVGAEVAGAPSRWSRALFWLYDRTAELDWTVRFHLKAVWGEHFKNEVPSSLLAVCDLPEQDWLGSDLPPYGQGTGLLAWMECCAASDSLRSTMLSRLSLDRRRPDHVGMFSKGLLVALTQTLPGCSASQWTRLLGALRELIASGRLHVPFSLEYVEFLPLLDLRGFSADLRLSVLLLRCLQLLCGSSCSSWLSADGWAHVGRLYAQAVRDMMSSVRAKLPLPPSPSLSVTAATSCPETSGDADPSVAAPKVSKDVQQEGGSEEEEEQETLPCQEVLFVLSQLFCHVQHIQVMMPGGQSEPLFLSSLEILSHYEAVMAAFPDSSSPLESDNTRHFFSTITDNLQSADMKAVLRQKIAQLVSSAA